MLSTRIEKAQSMKNFVLVLICTLFYFFASAQGRPINRMTMQTTYTQVDISKSIRDFVDEQKREDYFDDNFFNKMLKDVLQDEQFSMLERVQIFYLMQKKLGYAFVGLNYLPPKQNYFIFHLSKIAVYEKTRDALKELEIDPAPYLALADEHKTNDPIISSNALLLSTLLNSDKTAPILRKLTQSTFLMRSKNPVILNHYVCLSASISPDSIMTKNLEASLYFYKKEGMIEDVLCALFAKPHPLSTIKEYISKETNPLNDLAIETALCALEARVSTNAFSQNVKSMAEATPDAWKKEIIENVLAGKFPYNYSLSNEEQLVPKIWDGVQISIYTDGTLISNNTLLEFDPN